jgi:hypothetical protein
MDFAALFRKMPPVRWPDALPAAAYGASGAFAACAIQFELWAAAQPFLANALWVEVNHWCQPPLTARIRARDWLRQCPVFRCWN